MVYLEVNLGTKFKANLCIRNFNVLLTVNLSIFMLVINQLDVQN